MPLLNLLSRKPKQNAQNARQSPRLRNQGETRLAQNRTFSYAANRSQTDFNTGREAAQNKPPLRQLPGKIQKLRRHFGWLLATVAFIGLVGYEMQLSTTPKVVSLVQASDAPFLQDSSVYAQKASELFNATAANRNKLTVDTSNITLQLKKQFPELQDVSVSLPVIGDRPTVYIRPAAPALVLSSTAGSYVIDENGRAVAEETTRSGSSANKLQIPTVTDQSGLQVKVGSQVLPRSATAFVSTVVSQLKAQHVTVKSLLLPAAASELDIYVSNAPYFIKFNLHDADSDKAALQAGTYIATIKQLTRQGITPAQYVDVRLEGRAYYK
jgi:hypothetical protein